MRARYSPIQLLIPLLLLAACGKTEPQKAALPGAAPQSSEVSGASHEKDGSSPSGAGQQKGGSSASKDGEPDPSKDGRSATLKAGERSASKGGESAALSDAEERTANSEGARPLGDLPRPPTLPTAELVAAADLDGEGHDEILCWNKGALSIWGMGEESLYELHYSTRPEDTMPLGAPGEVWVGDLDRDGREDVLMGYGMTRDQPRVDVVLELLRIKGEVGSHRIELNTLYRAASPRAQVVGLTVADLKGDATPEILLAHYDSKYFVSAFLLSLEGAGDPLAGALPASKLTRIRMAASWAVGAVGRASRPLIVVGRPYGDKKLDFGDLFVLKGVGGLDLERELLPSKWGLRTLTIGDGDGDGQAEIYYGDGWHYDYGKIAEARLSVCRKGADGWKSELIDNSRGQYEIGRIEISDVDEDGKPEILAAGNKYVSLYWRGDKGWKVRRLAEGTDFALARLDGGGRVVVSGAPIRLIPLKDARAGGKPVGSGH